MNMVYDWPQGATLSGYTELEDIRYFYTISLFSLCVVLLKAIDTLSN